MLVDGCEVLTDGCSSARLTQGITSVRLADSLQALWAEVVACHEEWRHPDYDTCLAALGGDADEEEPNLETSWPHLQIVAIFPTF